MVVKSWKMLKCGGKYSGHVVENVVFFFGKTMSQPSINQPDGSIYGLMVYTCQCDTGNTKTEGVKGHKPSEVVVTLLDSLHTLLSTTCSGPVCCLWRRTDGTGWSATRNCSAMSCVCKTWPKGSLDLRNASGTSNWVLIMTCSTIGCERITWLNQKNWHAPKVFGGDGGIMSGNQLLPSQVRFRHHWFFYPKLSKAFYLLTFRSNELWVILHHPKLPPLKDMKWSFSSRSFGETICELSIWGNPQKWCVLLPEVLGDGQQVQRSILLFSKRNQLKRLRPCKRRHRPTSNRWSRHQEPSM